MEIQDNNTLSKPQKKLMSKSKKIIYGVTIFLIICFSIRLLCYQTTIGKYITLSQSPLNPFLTAILLLIIWFDYGTILIAIMRNFFSFKTLRNLTRFVVLPVAVLKIGFSPFIANLLSGNKGFSVLLLMLIIEGLIEIGLSIWYIIKDKKENNTWRTILFTFGMLFLLLIAALPSYFVQFMFGYGNPLWTAKEISSSHRFLLYLAFLIPVVIYFALRNKPQQVIRFALIYISVATMVGFLVNFNYTNFTKPWSWPFHLCNTAMFILPLCLIFKMKKFFYFTYFINVMGALFAMLMPNYEISENIFSMRIFNFWFNHWIAFFMPILCVALKEFKRPNIKQFYYSMVGFLGYFILALSMNVIFTALGHEVDYFFINSNYVGDKLGEWGNRLFNISTSFTINGMNFEFHPLYQVLFFLTYVLLGLGVWFVYNEFFIIADNHYELYLKLKDMKVHEYAYKATVSEQIKEEIMIEQAPAKLELKHFTKKYATSKIYAVEDANLSVYAGEIFGFLGPNGAGKSTIIKSIVGIQPITDGSIEICGYDVATESVKSKYNIGYVPDHYALYEKLTGREYINYIADIYEVPQEQRNERIEKYIRLFELTGSIDSKIRTYSHGMKQKITIMAALVHNPKVWILDEPLTGLDPNSIYQVKECMKQHAAEGNIVFFSSHIIDIVEKLCQRIAIIKKGKIQCVKTVKEIEDSGVSLEQFYMQVIGNNPEETK